VRSLAIRLVVMAVAALCWAVLAGGCASTESDIPWNEPQPWEGSPFIPGLPQD
jgi:hypothetical protein